MAVKFVTLLVRERLSTVSWIMTTRLNEQYNSVIKPSLKEEFGYGNDHQVPRIEKIVLNMGIGEASQDAKKID